jgi:kynurenine formamidase
VAIPERYAAVAGKVRNWGRWGGDDELGTLNLLTDDVRRRAAACVVSGRAIALGLPLSEREGIQTGAIPRRVNPLRTMTHVNTPLGPDPEWICSNEDMVVLATQCATHWDALAHVSYAGTIYNGFPASSVTSGGARRCGIHLVRTLVSRGVLLDVARAKGCDVLEPGYPIMPEDLDAACDMAHVAVEPGDVVLVRTGQMVHLGLHLDDIHVGDTHLGVGAHVRDLDRYAWPAPGLTMATAEWFHAHDVAAVATDTIALEVFPCEVDDIYLPVHLLHLVEMGMTQGQNWVLDALAEDCADDGRYTFLLDASPLPLTRGTASPLNPVAVK